MSLWGFDGAENTLTNWSAMSQFDDMVWNEFGENGDHVVPDPNGNPLSWTANGDHRKKRIRDGGLNGLLNSDSSSSRGGSDSCTENFESDQLDDDKDVSNGEEVPMQDKPPGSRWNDLGSVVNLPLESQQFNSGPLPTTQENEDISGSEELKDRSVSMLGEDVQLFIGEEDGSMVTDPFSLTEVGSHPGELFGDENTTSKAESLLDLGWENIGNLDDMDKLFRNNDTSFEPVMVGNTDGLEWPCSSPTSVSNPDRGLQIEKTSSEQGKTTVVKVEVDASENKIQPVSCVESQAALSSGQAQASAGFEDMNSDIANPKAPGLQKSASAQQLPEHGQEKNESTQETRAQRARRHAANRKRNEDKFKRGASYRKLSPGPPYAVAHGDMMQLPLRMPGQPSHVQRGPAPPGLQVYSPAPGLMNVPPHQFQMPSSVPYIQVGYPTHHMPIMPSKPMSNVQYPQPMFVDMQTASMHQQKPPNQLVNPMPSPHAKGPFQVSVSVDQQQLTTRPSFDGSSRPPTASPSMTPQEKLEKLRWRQQMQAIIAVEQQQQLLASQSGPGIEPLIFHRQQQTSSPSLAPAQLGRLSCESSEVIRKISSDIEQRRSAPVGVTLPVATGVGNEEDSSLEGSMLRQLEMTIAHLDIDTRLTIRNALYRLARSARKRRAAGENGCSSQSSGERNSGNNAMESSTASDSPSCRGSRATSMSEVETQTNPIDRTIAKLMFCKPQPKYLPGPVYVSENSPYPGVPQLPAGVPNATWGWSSAVVPPNNGVGPPGPLPVSASLPWGSKPDERTSPNSSWTPVVNGFIAPALPGYLMDPRFGAAFPVSKLRTDTGNMRYAAGPQPENKEETSMSPVPSLQTESCSSAGHVVRSSTQINNPPTSATNGHMMVKPQKLEFKGEVGMATMDTLGDNPPLNGNNFVPDRIHAGAVSNSGLQEVAHGGQFNSSNDSEHSFGLRNEAPCISEDPVQFLSSNQDEAGNLDQKPGLENLIFSTSSLDMASQPKDGMLEGLR